MKHDRKQTHITPSPLPSPRVQGEGGQFLRLAALSVVFITGCKVGPDYKAPPPVRVQDEYRATVRPVTTAPSTAPATEPAVQAAATQAATEPAPIDLTQWWTTFHDPILNSLIADAVDRNLDVRLAQERVVQARTELTFDRGGLFPTVDAQASYARSRASQSAFSAGGAQSSSTGGTGTSTGGTATGGTTNGGGTAGSTGSGSSPFTVSGGETSLWQGGFDASWELDVFGGTRRQIEAATYTLQSSIDARRNALISLLSELAQNYIMYRGYQHELAIVRRNVKSQSDTLGLQRQKLSAGIATDLTVAQAEAQLATTESQIPGLETNAKSALQRIAVLLDRDPSDVSAVLGEGGEIPVGPDTIPPGLPSDLLRRRPDIRQAERNLAAATATIGVATAELFPKFSLTGSVGTSSNKFRTAFNSRSIFYSFGPNVSWRIFDAGQIFANIQIEKSAQRQTLIEYRQAVIQSFSDVENSLTAYNREQIRRQALRRAVDSNRRSLDLARQLNNAGVVDFLNVLEAQLSLFQAEDQLAQSEQTVSTDLVSLYKALGGGWETTDDLVAQQPIPK